MRPGQTAPEFRRLAHARPIRLSASMRPGQTAPEFFVQLLTEQHKAGKLQ